MLKMEFKKIYNDGSRDSSIESMILISQKIPSPDHNYIIVHAKD